MRKTALTIIFIFALSSGVLFCGSGDKDMGFSDTFSVSDSVTNSIFAKTETLQEGTFKMVIVSRGVSSGFIKLNDEDIKKPDDFKNRDFNETVDIGLFEDNALEVEVRGKPGDQLCVQIYEIRDTETIRVIYERCVDRKAGPPNNESIDIDVSGD